MYTELLKLCGYEDDEIERERPRIDKAFEILKIGPGDIAHAETRIKGGFDVELPSVRRVLGTYIKRLVNLVLCREEWNKVVYTEIGEFRSNVALSLLDGVYAEQPSVLLGLSLGFILDKLIPVIESAEAHGMPTAGAMCTGTQLDLGAISMGIIPAPDACLVSGFYCDQMTKPYDIIQQLYGTRAVFMDGAWDAPWGQYPKIDPTRVAYIAARLRKGMRELGEAIGVEITEDVLKAGARTYAKLYYGLSKTAELLIKADPQPIGQASLILMRAAAMAHYERVQMKECPEIYEMFFEEIKERIARGYGVVPKGSPRVAMMAPTMADPAIHRMVEDCGIQTILWAHLELLPFQMERNPYTGWDEKAAHSLLASGYFNDSWAKLYRMKELCKIHNVDGVLWWYNYHCRFDGPIVGFAKKSIEKDLGIPVLDLEMDSFDPRTYSVGALRNRVEAFAELLKVRKSGKI